MTQFSGSIGFLSFVLALANPAFGSRGTAHAQSAYVGSWVVVPGSASGPLQGPLPSREMTIALTEDELVVKKTDLPFERYRTDGTDTRVAVGRTGRLTVSDAGMNLTTTRLRGAGRPDVNVENVDDLLTLRDNDLVLTRTIRYEQPKGSLTKQFRWEVRYRRQAP